MKSRIIYNKFNDLGKVLACKIQNNILTFVQTEGDLI